MFILHFFLISNADLVANEKIASEKVLIESIIDRYENIEQVVWEKEVKRSNQ